MRHRVAQWVAVILLLLPTGVFAEQKELRVGVIGEQPYEMIKKYTPLVNYLVSSLKAYDVGSGKVVAAKDLHELLQSVRHREVDIVFGSAFPTVEMKEREGMIPDLLAWRKDSKEYTTVFFVRKDSTANELGSLKGKTIVFQNEVSTSAYIVPKAELRQHGLKVLPWSEGMKGDVVNYSFADMEINQAFQVAERKADAGAFNNNDWDEIPPKVRDELKIIHTTKPILRYVVSFHPALPKKLRAAIAEALMRMDKSTDGQEALKTAYRIKKIEKLTKSDFESLDYVKELIRYTK